MRLDIGYAVRMGVSVQESLLDVCEEPALGALGGSVRRTPLAHGAWVDLRRGWLAGSGAVFARLAETVPWRAEKRHMYDEVVAVPRLLCFYGEDAPLPDPVLTAARQALTAHYRPELGEPLPTRRQGTRAFTCRPGSRSCFPSSTWSGSSRSGKPGARAFSWLSCSSRNGVTACS